ncbi:MAG: hypothetical protein ACOYKZ_01670 [Chlamydiia bacterium]
MHLSCRVLKYLGVPSMALWILSLGLFCGHAGYAANALCGVLATPGTPASGNPDQAHYQGGCVIQAYLCPTRSMHSGWWAIAPVTAPALPTPGITMPPAPGQSPVTGIYFGVSPDGLKLSLTGTPPYVDTLAATNICHGKSPAGGPLLGRSSGWTLVRASPKVHIPTYVIPHLIITGLQIPASSMRFTGCQGTLTGELLFIKPSATMSKDIDLPSPVSDGSASPYSTLNGYSIAYGGDYEGSAKYNDDIVIITKALVGTITFWNYKDPRLCPAPTQ